MLPIDLDHDQFLDLLYINLTHIAWLRNKVGDDVDGNQKNGQAASVDFELAQAAPTMAIAVENDGFSLSAADVDLDGEVDVLCSQGWYRNLGGGHFGERNSPGR